MKLPLFLLIAASALVSFSRKDGSPAEKPADGYVGYLYTSTNDNAGNGIIALGRKADGTVAELPGSPYKTGAIGDAADGDFDTQWALRTVGDYLLAVNAGANPVNGSLSVFEINRADGSLRQVDQNPATPAMDNLDSHGVRAAAFATTTKGATTWVVVANQFSSPLYVESPPKLIGKIEDSSLRNLAVFTFNPATGRLAFRRLGPVYHSGKFNGPITVEFNPAGTRLLAVIEGVPHAFTPDVDLKVQTSGQLHLYDFAAGHFTPTGVFEEAGISGSIGASWSPNGRYVYLTNAALHSSKKDNSLTVHDGTTAAKVQQFTTAGRNDEVCWTLISRDQRKLYAASFSQNVLSVFDIGAHDQLSQSLTPNFFPRKPGTPMFDTKDLYETPGYLYALGAFQSHAIATFRTSASGTLTETANSPYPIPSSVGKTKMQQDFLGLTGFEK